MAISHVHLDGPKVVHNMMFSGQLCIICVYNYSSVDKLIILISVMFDQILKKRLINEKVDSDTLLHVTANIKRWVYLTTLFRAKGMLLVRCPHNMLFNDWSLGISAIQP